MERETRESDSVHSRDTVEKRTKRKKEKKEREEGDTYVVISDDTREALFLLYIHSLDEQRTTEYTTCFYYYCSKSLLQCCDILAS